MNSRMLKAAVFGLVSYVFLYFLYSTQDFLPKWDGYGSRILNGQPLEGYLFVDPLFLFIPVIGFVFAWLSVSWYLRHFRDEQILSIPAALVYVVGSYFAFFIAVLFFFWNNSFLVVMSRGSSNATIESFGFAWEYTLTNFLDFLLQSPFFLFVLAGLLGWVSYWIIHRYWGEKLPHLAST
ncbi:MAG: hypothetical protein V1776_02080 [Candidatus Diapherotrites archaeon]